MKFKIYSLMKQRGVTLEQLAEYTGLSRNTISALRNDDVNCKIETFIKLADYFGVTIDQLLGRPDVFDVETFMDYIRRYFE